MSKKTEVIPLYVTLEQKERIRTEADRQGVGMSSLVKIALFDYLYHKKEDKNENSSRENNE
jgi:hypothetical protein